MDSPHETIRTAPARGWGILGGLSALGPIGYGLGLWAASIADGRAPGETFCFDPAMVSHFMPLRLAIAMVTAIGAILFLFVTPWLLGMLALMRIPSKRPTAGAWSLAANSAALILVCLLLRHTTEVNRGDFFLAWLAWTAILLGLARDPTHCLAEVRSLWRRWGAGLMIGAAAVTVAIVLFRREHFVQCFNGDGTEFCDLAQSLRHHFLPYWEIETIGRFGTFVANPTVINSYWTLGLQLLLGEGELATRLPCWIWWLGVFLISLRMVQGERDRAAWLPAIPLALALLLVSVWYTFYVGYYPYMADPAAQAVVDAMFTLLLLLAWDCLRHGDTAGWLLSMMIASLMLYAGVVMFMLMTAAALVWQPVPWRQMLRAARVAAMLLLAVFCGYLAVGWWEGSLSGWWSTLHQEVFRKYFTPGPESAAVGQPWRLSLWYVGYFLLGCGGLPAIGLLRGFWGKRADADRAWDRTVTTVTLAYLLIILGSGHKNLHYLGPLLPIPLILWLKCRQGPGQTATARWTAPLVATGCLAVCLLLCWPRSREPVFTLNRELGAITTFQTDSYEEACRWGEIAGELYDRGDFGWQIGEHTWASYSQRHACPAAPRPLVVTNGAPPSGEFRYELVFESAQVEGVKVYGRDPQAMRWVASQRPKTSADRCPPVFRPIAQGHSRN